MTIEVFKHLTELEQLNTLIINGQPIGQSADNWYRLFLYKVSSFNVTVTFCAQTDQLLSIRSFDHYTRTLPVNASVEAYFSGRV